MEGKEKKMAGGEDGFMDTGTGRSVGIGLSVLWYRMIVQRKNIEWLFKTATQKLLDPHKAWPNRSRSSQIVLAHRVLISLSPEMNSLLLLFFSTWSAHLLRLSSDFQVRSSHQFLGHQFICFLLLC